MSYYRNYGGQRSTQRTGYNSPSGGPPKRLLPEHLHDVFRIEISRLNDNREAIEDSLLFDSDDTEQSVRSGTDSDSHANKYQLRSLYIGEIWRFRLKITNKLNENLHNFGLLCHVEINLKGSGSPIQLYPRPRELCPTQMNKRDNISVDLEYPVVSNEPSSYSLIVTITASNSDDSNQLYKNIFEFHTIPCISLTFQKQTLDENLFVEALINNCSTQPKLGLFVSVNFKCLGLFKSYNLTHHNQSKLETAGLALNELYLEPQQEQNVLFQIEMKNPTSLVNLNALSVGQIEVKWRSNRSVGFREGIFLSDIIQRRSLFCRKLENQNQKQNTPGDNIEILILKCPSSCIVHKSFVVTFHIFNLDRYSHKLWLSIDKNTCGYLLPYNISKKCIGILEPSSSIKTDMTLIAFAPGIHILTGIVIQTQRLNTMQPIVQKTMHYESTQYIYIDIDPQFHSKKIQEKQLKLEMEQEQNDSVKDVEDVDLDDDKEEDDNIINNEGVINVEDDNEAVAEEAEEDANVEELIEKQMGRRGSMEIKVDQNASPLELEQEYNIQPSPKHKPVIPPSSDLKPIGHQKTEQEIMEEEEKEHKQRIASLRPMKTAEISVPDADDEEDDDADDEEDDDEDDGSERKENKVDNKEEKEDAEDEVSQSPLEIENEDEEEEKENDENHLNLRDLGALDANDSAISAASVTIKSETGESRESQEEIAANTTPQAVINTDVIDENEETNDNV